LEGAWGIAGDNRNRRGYLWLRRNGECKTGLGGYLANGKEKNGPEKTSMEGKWYVHIHNRETAAGNPFSGTEKTCKEALGKPGSPSKKVAPEFVRAEPLND